MPSRSHFSFRLFFVFLMALAVSGCANLIGPRDVSIPLSRLQEGLQGRFPYSQRYAGIFDVNLTNPVLALQPESGRIVIDVDAALGVPLAGKSWPGKLGMSGALQIDRARQAVMLADTRIERFSMVSVDEGYAKQIGRIGELLTQQFLRELPIYTFRPEDLRYAGVSFTPVKIATTANALVVTFEPVK